MRPGTRLTQNGRKKQDRQKGNRRKIETGNYDGEAGIMNRYTFEELTVGQTESYSVTVTEDMLAHF